METMCKSSYLRIIRDSDNDTASELDSRMLNTEHITIRRIAVESKVLSAHY